MKLSLREIPGLEFHLLRRGVGTVADRRETCQDCGRTPLVGEHVHQYRGERIVCELCKALRGEEPVSSRLVHGPAFGHAVRITDQREARSAAVRADVESE